MSRAPKTPLALLALLAASLLAASCATQVGPARVSARVGTRIPGYTYEKVDGTIQQIEAVEPKGDTLFLFLRARY